MSIRNGAHVVHSLVADGCIIEGTVENSVLSPGVVVRAGAMVRNSVVMTDTVVGRDAQIDYSILDKRVRIGEAAILGCGGIDVPGVPAGLYDGLTVVGKNTRIPPSLEIRRNCTIAADLDEEAFAENVIPCGAAIGLPAE